jgi:hypothetical protein
MLVVGRSVLLMQIRSSETFLASQFHKTNIPVLDPDQEPTFKIPPVGFIRAALGKLCCALFFIFLNLLPVFLGFFLRERIRIWNKSFPIHSTRMEIFTDHYVEQLLRFLFDYWCYLVVGVGHEDFHAMSELDSDDSLLRSGSQVQIFANFSFSSG